MSGRNPQSSFYNVSYRSLEIRDITEGFDRIVAFLVAGIGINPCKEPLAGFEINSIPGTGHHRLVSTFWIEQGPGRGEKNVMSSSIDDPRFTSPR